MNEIAFEKFKRLKLSEYYDKWIQEEKISGATLEITPKCNLKCVHCYMGDLRKRNEGLSFDEITRVIDILYDNGVLFLTLSGGEPLLHKDFKKIYLYAKKKGFIVDVFTNGTLLNKEIVDLFAEYPPLLVDISLYGANENTYAKVTGANGMLDVLIKNFTMLRNAGIRFSVKAPVLNINCDELAQMRKIAETYSTENFRYDFHIVPDRENKRSPLQFEVDPLQAIIAEIKDGSNEGMLKDKAQQIKNSKSSGQQSSPVYFCSIGQFSVHIDYCGFVSPCIECCEKYNIFDQDFNTICKEFLKYKKLCAKGDYKCAFCRAMPFCTSCPQIRKRLYGNEQTVRFSDCITAELKYRYYVENYTLDELKKYYKEAMQ